jgi:hypothetical protein
MTLDGNLIEIVNKATKHLGLTRSVLKKAQIDELERKQRDGYKRKPVKYGEFGDWEAEQVWVEP